MHVQPVPVGPTGGRGRIGTIVSAFTPVAALAVVVLVALAGAKPGSPPTASRPAPLVGPATSESGQPADPAGSTPEIARSTPDPFAVPRFAFNLPVRTIEDLLDARQSGEVTRGLVSVQGWLQADIASSECAGAPLIMARIFCRRPATLFADPPTLSGAASSRSVDGSPVETTTGDRLPAMFLPGTPTAGLPLDPDLTDRVFEPRSVVVVGRFDAARAVPCQGERRSCDDGFVVERVAWADGRWLDRPLIRDPLITEAAVPAGGPRALAIAAREQDRMESILAQAILGPELLAWVDPGAAAAVVAGDPGPYWYVRSVSRLGKSDDRSVVWAVIHHRSGLTIGYSLPQP